MSSKQDTTPANDADGTTERFFFRAWHGMALDAWLGLMKGNWGKVSPSRYPLVATIFAVATVNQIRKWLSHAIYGRRLAAVQVAPDPVFVIGHWRSGTTWLHQTLLADPRFAGATAEACFNPEAFLVGRRVLAPILPFFFPGKRPMDNVSVGMETAEEDEWGLALSGAPSPMRELVLPTDVPPGSMLNIDEMTPEDAARWRKVWMDFLRRVQFINPGKRLVLKSPGHTARTAEILRLFPNARFIHIVRDPYRIFSSVRKASRAMRASQSLRVGLQGQAELDRHAIQRFLRLHEYFHAVRDDIPDGQIVTIRYEDLKADTPAVLRGLYQTLELGDYDDVAHLFERQGVKASGYKTNTFTLDDEAIALVDANWHEYFTRYGYKTMAERADANP